MTNFNAVTSEYLLVVGVVIVVNLLGYDWNINTVSHCSDEIIVVHVARSFVLCASMHSYSCYATVCQMPTQFHCALQIRKDTDFARNRNFYTFYQSSENFLSLFWLSEKCWSHSTLHRKFLWAPHVDINTSNIIFPNKIKKISDRNKSVVYDRIIWGIFWK